MAFTPEEVTEAILVAQNRENLKGHEDYVRRYPDYAYPYRELTTPEWDEVHMLETSLGTVKTVEQVGGGEGDGEHVHVVIQTVDSGQFFKIEGYYSSYEGTDWDGSELHEVFPREKTITVYE